MGTENGIDLLLQQHEQIRSLFQELSAGGGPAGKQEKFDELRRLLAVHETAEELVVRPTTRSSVDGGKDIAEKRMSEENEAKKVLSELEKLGVDEPRFIEIFNAFHKDVEEHAQHEEQEEFPKLRTSCDADALAKMGKMIRAAEAAAPTHPHPSAKTTTANLVLGPVAAIVDRVRDAVKGAAS